MSTSYEGPDRRTDLSNSELSDQLAEFRQEIRDYVAANFVTKEDFERRLDRQTSDIVREVSATLNVFTRDAIKEIFRDLYEANRKQDRQEMIDNFVSVVKRTSTVADILRPIITVGSILFGIWASGQI